MRAQAVLQVQVEQPEPVQVQAVLKDPVPVEQPEGVPEQQEQLRELTYAAFPVQMMQAWQTLKVREPAQTVKAPAEYPEKMPVVLQVQEPERTVKAPVMQA